MKKAILCVDDEAIIVMSLKEELRSHYRDRFVYETALSASEALAIIEELESDGTNVIALLSDWLMPGIKGDEFLAQVHARHPGIKAVIITGHADETQLDRFKEKFGLTAVLRKPWNTTELIEAVDKCLA
jgi:CheY-like chemotaxis protein